MRIAFYAPFKPLNHPQPSGDMIIGNELRQYLMDRGHAVSIASGLRCRWIYWKPWLLPLLVRDRRRVQRRYHSGNTDIWFTFHSYYKGPDMLGPFLCRRAQIPYVMFQGIYATKYRKSWKTWPGFMLNRHALQTACHVFTNKHGDYLNLRRLLPQKRLSYIIPGIEPEDFRFDAFARESLRKRWQVDDNPVLVAAAMFRPDVKTQSLAWLIETCGELFRTRRRFYLVIAGDGSEKAHLMRLADVHLPGRVRFVGKIARDEMHRFYSAGDLFTYPGINESLGMAFLESQSCGLPVVAFDNAGIPEVVRDRQTGFLVPMFARRPYMEAIDLLLTDTHRRRQMGRAASVRIRQLHDLKQNYRRIDQVIRCIGEGQRKPRGTGGGYGPADHIGYRNETR
jgi:glycosyltransferase involved in cell wall biosynthesis